MNYLVCGYLGYQNLGDELMANAISSSLFKYDKSAGVTFFAPRGKKYENFNCTSRYSPVKVIKSIKNCDVFILGGGTLLSEEASRRSAWYYSFILFLARIMKKKRIVWAGGIDRIKSKPLKRMMERELADVRISLRDTQSLDALWDIMPCPNAKIHADPVFLLARNSADFNSYSRNILTVCIKSDAPKDLAIMIGKFCQKHALIPIFAATSPKDMQECKNQSKLINAKSILLTNVEDAKKLFTSSALCLSMRYHAVLLAACFGCIPISMSRSEKILALMNELALKQLILPASYSYTHYQNTLESALANMPKYQKACQTATKEMLRRAELAEAFLLDI